MAEQYYWQLVILSFLLCSANLWRFYLLHFGIFIFMIWFIFQAQNFWLRFTRLTKYQHIFQLFYITIRDFLFENLFIFPVLQISRTLPAPCGTEFLIRFSRLTKCQRLFQILLPVYLLRCSFIMCTGCNYNVGLQVDQLGRTSKVKVVNSWLK